MTVWIRRVGALAIAGVVSSVALLDVASARPVALSSNIANSISAQVVAPPIGATTSADLNVVPPLTCTVIVRWDPSPTPTVDGYDVRRVDAATGEVIAGPWRDDAPPLVDPAVPLFETGASVAWEVRALAGGWPSEWTSASSGALVPCLLP